MCAYLCVCVRICVCVRVCVCESVGGWVGVCAHAGGGVMGVREGKAVRHAHPVPQPLICHGYEGGQGSEACTPGTTAAHMPWV